MSMSQTSLEAYQAIQNLGGKQRTVYNALNNLQPANNQQIADYLGWPINRVTGRVNELQKLNLAQVEYIDKNEFARNVKFWSTADPGDSKIAQIAKQNIIEHKPEWMYE